MYSQSFQPSFGQQQPQQPVQSQYRGFQKPFQPTGYVQSFYQQQQQSQQQPQQLQQQQPQQLQQQPQQLQQQQQPQQPVGYAAAAQPTSYHLPNYAGNQPGHDASWREDSVSPSSFAAPRTQSIGVQPQPTYGTATVSSFQQQQQPVNVQPQPYHLPHYAGNQPGHDASWREDSQRPSTFAAGQPQQTIPGGTQGTFTASAPANTFAQGQTQFRSF